MTPIAPRDFLTKADPLGPTRHETINIRSGDQYSNFLVFRTQVFDEIIASRRPLISGRRGAGKTAAVNALVATAYEEQYSWSSQKVSFTSKNIILFIDSWKDLDVLVERVTVDIGVVNGSNLDWASITPEQCARYWRKYLWNAIFEQIYQSSIAGRPTKPVERHLSEVNKYITGRDFLSSSSRIGEYVLDQAFEKVRDSVLDYLVTSGTNCIVVIDSLDQYPLTSLRFERVISGLFRCVNQFADMFPRCYAYCCLPEELEPTIIEHYPNLYKDGTESSSLSRLQWRPVDLMRIVAKRFREFLKANSKGLGSKDRIMQAKLNTVSLDERSGISFFFDTILPDMVSNRMGCEEPTLAYILRHTQLLPREVLSIFSTILRNCYKRSECWTQISTNDIVDAIDREEGRLSENLLQPFRVISPNIGKEIKRIACQAELRPVFSGTEARCFKSLVNTLESWGGDPLEALFHMGVIGYIDDADNSGNQSDYYIFARFHFNSSRPIAPSRSGRYCFHPLYSGSWHLRRPENSAKMKYIYPADVPFRIS
jgi:hypothetical protein